MKRGNARFDGTRPGARSVSWTQECDAGKPRSLPAQPRAGRHESRFVPHRADLDLHHRGDGRQHGYGRRPRGGEREEKVPTRGDAPDPGIHPTSRGEAAPCHPSILRHTSILRCVWSSADERHWTLGKHHYSRCGAAHQSVYWRGARLVRINRHSPRCRSVHRSPVRPHATRPRSRAIGAVSFTSIATLIPTRGLRRRSAGSRRTYPR